MIRKYQVFVTIIILSLFLTTSCGYHRISPVVSGLSKFALSKMTQYYFSGNSDTIYKGQVYAGKQQIGAVYKDSKANVFVSKANRCIFTDVSEKNLIKDVLSPSSPLVPLVCAYGQDTNQLWNLYLSGMIPSVLCGKDVSGYPISDKTTVKSLLDTHRNTLFLFLGDDNINLFTIFGYFSDFYHYYAIPDKFVIVDMSKKGIGSLDKTRVYPWNNLQNNPITYLSIHLSILDKAKIIRILPKYQKQIKEEFHIADTPYLLKVSPEGKVLDGRHVQEYFDEGVISELVSDGQFKRSQDIGNVKVINVSSGKTVSLSSLGDRYILMFYLMGCKASSLNYLVFHSWLSNGRKYPVRYLFLVPSGLSSVDLEKIRKSVEDFGIDIKNVYLIEQNTDLGSPYTKFVRVLESPATPTAIVVNNGAVEKRFLLLLTNRLNNNPDALHLYNFVFTLRKLGYPEFPLETLDSKVNNAMKKLQQN